MASAGTTTATISAFTISLFGLQQCTIDVPSQSITVVSTDRASSPDPTPSPTPSPPPSPTATPIEPIPVGSTFALLGDGIMSEGGAPGERNAVQWFMTMMSGRLQPVPAYNLSQSGTSIYNAAGNYAWAAIGTATLAAQKPDVAIFGSIGHNDNVLGLAPAGSQPLADWKTALDAFIAANDEARLIPVIGTAPSKLATEAIIDAGQSASRRQRVWEAQAAYVAAKNDPRVIFVDVSSIDPETWSPAADGTRVHPDDRGALLLAQLMVAAISPRVRAATPAEVQALIDAGAYPLMGTAIDADRALAGAGGSVSGLTGTIATSKSITNNTGSNGFSVAMQPAAVAGRQKIVVTFGGGAATAANLQIIDKANFGIPAATPGQYVMQAWSLRMSGLAGINRFGFDWGALAAAFGGSAPGTSSTLSGNIGVELNTLMLMPSRPIFGAAPSGKRAWGFRFAGAPLAGTLELEQPAAWIVNNRTRHRPLYVGDVKPVGGMNLYTASLRLRPAGSVTAATGGTIRVEPGLWAPAGLTEADFATRRIYKGTSASTAIGSGSLLATLSGSSWSYAVPAGAVTKGDLVFVEIDCTNGVGEPVTVRSVSTITAG